MSASTHDVALNGNIDHVSAEGVVAGWCWSPDAPGTRRILCLAIDGIDIAETVAGEARPDLAAAGFGDGAYGFSLRLAPSDIPQRASSVLTLRDVATGQMVGSEVAVTWPRAAEPASALVGNLEQASQEGWVSGWAWYPAEPERRVNLDILVDGSLVGSTRASLFRPDLEQAGIGDGRYGFSFALPWSVLASKGEMTLSVRDGASGTEFGNPIAMRIGRLVEVEERIGGLERQVRLLQARIAEQEAAFDPHREQQAMQAMFRTIAAFFHDLAEAPEPGRPAAAALNQAVGAVLDSHAPLVLAIPENPEATLVLLGDAPCDALHAALLTLRETGADRLADIVLLDGLRHGADIALLPAIVRNLRYARVKSGVDEAVARTDIAAAARGEVIVVFSPHLRPAPGALAALLAALAASPDVALVSAAVLRGDGLLEHAGLMADAEGFLVDVGRAEDPARADLAAARDVDAVGDFFFAVRRDALLEAGGFPPGYASPASAVAGLCLALREGGHRIVVEPAARAVLVETEWHPVPPSVGDVRRLRDRWAALG